MSIPLDDVPAEPRPGFQRTARPDRQFVEVRPLLPVEVVAVIDAACINEAADGRPVDRQSMVRRILSNWARQEHHKAMVILRTAGANPLQVDQE